MKKYKILKPFPGFDVGETISELTIYNGVMSLNIDLNNTYWFEEIKERANFKVGDKVVMEEDDKTIYLLITDMYFRPNFNDYLYNGYSDLNFRKPTEEELKKYFR